MSSIPKAPTDFMRTVACLLHTVATAPGDRIFGPSMSSGASVHRNRRRHEPIVMDGTRAERGEYGQRLYVVCTGTGGWAFHHDTLRSM